MAHLSKIKRGYCWQGRQLRIVEGPRGVARVLVGDAVDEPGRGGRPVRGRERESVVGAGVQRIRLCKWRTIISNFYVM